MAWRFRYQSSDGADAVAPDAGEPPSFSSQSDAESWIGEEWQMLLEAGVDAVSLFEDDREVYGPMSLHPPAE
jgi:hypothetical protein